MAEKLAAEHSISEAELAERREERQLPQPAARGYSRDK
jgi:hypothetical protein